LTGSARQVAFRPAHFGGIFVQEVNIFHQSPFRGLEINPVPFNPLVEGVARHTLVLHAQVGGSRVDVVERPYEFPQTRFDIVRGCLKFPWGNVKRCGCHNKLLSFFMDFVALPEGGGGFRRFFVRPLYNVCGAADGSS
jgi:hypothetical protein